MVNMVSCYTSMLHKTAKLVGFEPKLVEIEPPGTTVINFWVPSKSKPSKTKPKPPLVLIHGFAGDGLLTWQFQLFSSLRKNYTIYIPDLLFFGGSYTSRSDRTPRFQAECMADGLRKLGVAEKCIVVGFSYGGFIGFEMARHHPDLVGSMVVTGSVLALSQSISSKALERVGLASWLGLMPATPQDVKVMFRIGSYKLPWLPSFFYKQYLEAMFSNRKERMELLEAMVVKDEDVTNYQYQQRIHLLWGHEDKIFNLEVANNLKEKLGGKTMLITVKKAGHLAMFERRRVFNNSLKQLLASLAADR